MQIFTGVLPLHVGPPGVRPRKSKFGVVSSHRSSARARLRPASFGTAPPADLKQANNYLLRKTGTTIVVTVVVAVASSIHALIAESRLGPVNDAIWIHTEFNNEW